MKRTAKRYLKPEGWNLKGHFLTGTEWSVAGSKLGTAYTVTLEPQGFTCECQGFMFKGKCKHSEQILQAFDNKQDYSIA